MILWKSKVQREKQVVYEDAGIRAWRRVLDVDLTSISLRSEVKFNMDTPEESKEWRWGQGTTLSITKHFHFGVEHMYYDGPHCLYSLGFLHLCYEPDWCTKCMLDKDSKT